jgi:hypothetical protein
VGSGVQLFDAEMLAGSADATHAGSSSRSGFHPLARHGCSALFGARRRRR